MTAAVYTHENLARLKMINDLVPRQMESFSGLEKAAVGEGVLSVKTRELISIAVALTTRCPYCITIHSGNARKAGATNGEIAEAVLVAASLSGARATTHASHPLPMDLPSAGALAPGFGGDGGP